MTVDQAGTQAPPRARPSSRAEDLGTILATCWLLAGAGLDARAHSIGSLETFFTWWHATLYSGFAAMVAWVTFLSARRRAGARGLVRSAPPGYEAAWIGLGMFTLGAAGDLLWHEIFGIEQDIAATFSPTHLLLFLGAILIIASPLRATLRTPAVVAPFAAIASMTFIATITTLILTWLSPLVFPDAAFFTGTGARGGIAALLVTNLVVMTPALFLLARWRLPFGSILALWSIPAVAVVFANTPAHHPLVWAHVGAGALADIGITAARIDTRAPFTLRALGAALPLLVWGAYFSALGTWRALAWDVEIWTGTMILASLSGFTLAWALTSTPVLAMPRARDDSSG